MLFLQAPTIPTSLSPFKSISFRNPAYKSNCYLLCVARKSESVSDPEREPNSNPKAKSKKTTRRRLKAEVEAPQKDGDEKPDGSKILPETIPRKPRRGRRSEAAAVEDFIRGSLERTFASIREQDSEVFENKEKVMKDRVEDDEVDTESHEDEDEGGISGGGNKKMVVEEESANWPLDADVGWGIRASEYFEQHPIKNVVGEDGVEIDWEGEVDDNWVKEINCLEWESFAFHPSPLIVLVFERYNR